MKKPLKFIKYIILQFFICGPIMFLNAQNKVVVDEIIAKVDNYILLKSDLEKAYLNYLTTGNVASDEAKCGVLSQLVSSKLMLAKAEIDSVVVSDEEVDANLERRMQIILSQYGGSQEQLEKLYGKSIETIKLDIRGDIEEQLIVQKMQDEIISEIKITPAEVRKFYNRIPNDSLPYFSTEVVVAQLVKHPKVSKQKINELKLTLTDLRNRVLDGENFEELAKKHSEGPSATYGGNLGFSQRGMMDPEYEANTITLEQNGISKPFETSFGVHISQLLERRGNEYNSRHIILTPKPTSVDIERTSNFLDSLRWLIQRDSLSFEEAVKEYSEDVVTAGNGGYFTNPSGGLNVSVEDIDPTIFFTIDTMTVGNISKPITFTQENGKQAVRIIYYKSKTKPHQANLEDDWQKIQEATLNQKKATMLNEWFDKAKDDVFIGIDSKYDYCGIMK